MNLFVLLLVLVLIVGWLGSGIALVVGPGIYIVQGIRGVGEAGDGFLTIMAAGGVLVGLGLLLLFAAIATGGISLAHPDGCYFIHTQLVGKTVVQLWDPIRCP